MLTYADVCRSGTQSGRARGWNLAHIWEPIAGAEQGPEAELEAVHQQHLQQDAAGTHFTWYLWYNSTSKAEAVHLQQDDGVTHFTCFTRTNY
jgi:hypothetical protein